MSCDDSVRSGDFAKIKRASRPAFRRNAGARFIISSGLQGATNGFRKAGVARSDRVADVFRESWTSWDGPSRGDQPPTPASSAAAAQKADEEAIHQTAKAFEAAFRAKNADAIAAGFTAQRRSRRYRGERRSRPGRHCRRIPQGVPGAPRGPHDRDDPLDPLRRSRCRDRRRDDHARSLRTASRPSM